MRGTLALTFAFSLCNFGEKGIIGYNKEERERQRRSGTGRRMGAKEWEKSNF